MGIFSRLAVVSALPASANKWVAGGGMCGYTDADNNIYLGIQKTKSCDGALDSDTQPEKYVKFSVSDMGLIKDSTDEYLTDAGKLELIAKTEINAGESNQDSDDDIKIMSQEPIKGTHAGNDFEVAASRAGHFYGDSLAVDDGAFGFIGTGAYLMTKGAVEYNAMDFLIPNGSPSGLKVPDMCVVPGTGDDFTACGAKRTATILDNSPAYKFSIYGYTDGTKFLTNVVNGKNARYFGVRQTIDLTKMGGTAAQIQINDGNWTLASEVVQDPTLVNVATQITKLKFKAADDNILSMEFPQKYLVGHVDVSGDTPLPVPKKNKDVVIWLVTSGTGAATKLALDFIFEFSDGLEKGRHDGGKKVGYFVYDPDLSSPSVTDAASRAPSSSAAESVGAAAESVGSLFSGAVSSASLSITAGCAAAAAAFMMLF